MKQLTEIIFILDKSGSMHGLEDDTIGGFNSLISKQLLEEGEALITTTLFNSTYEIIHDRINIKDVKELTHKDYNVSGTTALLDTIGDMINHIKLIHRYINTEDVPTKTLFVITTDGYENASHKYSAKDIKRMIEAQKENGWEFIFLGANIDAFDTAKELGIDESRTSNYDASKAGTAILYESLNDVVGNIRRCEVYNEKWKAKLPKRSPRSK